jgi:hypothetical protein
MFKNKQFGGCVAETYRSLNMLSPWLFQCLLDDEFAPRKISSRHLMNPV